ncbi:uncharacterized protein LOC125750665 isoform X1 [Brienomyrus brachyistius]|uniref:uncharacterized protein LOC125750665 isoform X1 n=1 Tax=Brienomyrus brachyistius TaxID=42636 RepID=UPI0020B2EDD6|nr:uncharacterized protein LOC125750665 isoform X1 [Brienomyrus brachyistius]
MSTFWLFLWIFQTLTCKAEKISQPSQCQRAHPGDAVTLQCYVLPEIFATLFWLKHPMEGRPTCLAVAVTHLPEVYLCEELHHNPRINVTKNSYSFNISFKSLEPSDAAKYYCGALAYSTVIMGNGTQLDLNGLETQESGSSVTDNKTQDETSISGKDKMNNYLVPVLVATNTASVAVILAVILLLKQRRMKNNHSRADNSLSRADGNLRDQGMDTMNYSTLNFTQKNKARRSGDDLGVTYATVRCQQL